LQEDAMSLTLQSPAPEETVYPDSDGQPMADSTLQFRWIVTIKEGLEALFRSDPEVFVAGDLLWYPVEGNWLTRAAPDVLVAFGRPKGDRGSYQQWLEGGIALQVVFEVLSPGNRPLEMTRKFAFYERHGVEEYYIYDPELRDCSGWLRAGTVLQEIPAIKGWVSPRLGVRFDIDADGLRLYRANGEPLLSYAELVVQRDAAERRAEQERERAELLAAQLRAAGLEPEA
jgi:Uma2 family endonuclease